MIRWLKSLFAWREVRSTGVWLYRENAITGQRAAHQIMRGCYQPLDHEWLSAGSGDPLIDGVRARLTLNGWMIGDYEIGQCGYFPRAPKA